MALADKPPAATKRGRCGIERLELTDKDLDILNSWIGAFSDQAVSDRLAEDDYRVSAQVISHHRRRTCNCYR